MSQPTHSSLGCCKPNYCNEPVVVVGARQYVTVNHRAALSQLLGSHVASHRAVNLQCNITGVHHNAHYVVWHNSPSQVLPGIVTDERMCKSGFYDITTKYVAAQTKTVAETTHSVALQDLSVGAFIWGVY